MSHSLTTTVLSLEMFFNSRFILHVHLRTTQTTCSPALSIWSPLLLEFETRQTVKQAAYFLSAALRPQFVGGTSHCRFTGINKTVFPSFSYSFRAHNILCSLFSILPLSLHILPICILSSNFMDASLHLLLLKTMSALVCLSVFFLVLSTYSFVHCDTLTCIRLPDVSFLQKGAKAFALVFSVSFFHLFRQYLLKFSHCAYVSRLASNNNRKNLYLGLVLRNLN